MLGGVVSGLADGGIGGGNLLSHVAQNIVGGSGGNTSRAVVPGALDMNAGAEPSPITTPGMYVTDLDFANALDERPDINPRPSQRPKIDSGTTMTSTTSPSFGEQTYANEGEAFANSYSDSIGPSQSGCSCSTRKRYTCEEKCAYNAQMKEKCKGCKPYFRKTKQYVYPKRRKTCRSSYRRRSYRRSYRRKSYRLKPGTMISTPWGRLPYNPYAAPRPTYPGLIPPTGELPYKAVY